MVNGGGGGGGGCRRCCCWFFLVFSAGRENKAALSQSPPNLGHRCYSVHFAQPSRAPSAFRYRRS